MALLDPYCDADGYRARIGDNATGSDADLTARLTAISRLLERKLRVAPGAFNSATGTRRFSGNDKNVLWLADDSGQHFLQSVDEDGITVDDDEDGTADYTFDPTNETWVVGLPRNAAVFSEPYDRLQILDLTANTSLHYWPKGEFNIAVAGTWGWSAVPGIIADLVAHRTHEVEQALVGGGATELPTFDGVVPLQPKTLWLWREAERLHGIRTPRVA